MRWGIAAGWLLAVPGLVVIASFVLVWPLASWAGCQAAGIDMYCPPSPAGRLAGAVGTVVAYTVVLAYAGVGLVPPLYSALWLLLRLARRVGWWWVLGGVVLAGAVARVATS